MITKFKNKKGFTVLESIVAIFILSLSISGAFSAVQQSFSQAIIAKDEVQSFYLAQEAMEIIRNKRDSNQLNKITNGSLNTWLEGITQGGDGVHICPFGHTCTVDATSFQIVDCGGDWDSCPNINQDPAAFLYSYNAGLPVTNFKREIQIERVQNDSLGNPIEIAVIVRISWTKGVMTGEFKVKNYLFNWI
jgi:prepilin-type N-terminal cleavage/methylation domain-containing protein